MCWGHIVTFLWALTAVIRAQVPVHAPKVVPKGVPQPPTPHWGWDIDQGVRLAHLGAHLDVQPSTAPHMDLGCSLVQLGPMGPDCLVAAWKQGLGCLAAA